MMATRPADADADARKVSTTVKHHGLDWTGNVRARGAQLSASAKRTHDWTGE